MITNESETSMCVVIFYKQIILILPFKEKFFGLLLLIVSSSFWWKRGGGILGTSLGTDVTSPAPAPPVAKYPPTECLRLPWRGIV